MKTKRLELLISLKQELESYLILQCGQKHEQIVSVSAAIFTGHQDYPDLQIKTRGLCDKTLRNQNLGCAHTIAAERYKAVLEKMIKEELLPAKDNSIHQLGELLLRIYLLDHRKGTMEKHLAVNRYRTPLQEPDTNQNTADDELIQLNQEHRLLIGQLRTFHDQLLHRLDQLITEYQKN